MEIYIKRIAKRENYTIGKLFINGTYFCDTLEDKDRGLDESMTEEEIARIKVYGKTAIPTGHYKIGVTFWQKHKINVPYLAKVKGFRGIFIHGGVTHLDTLGCILVGYNKIVGKLINSGTVSGELTRQVREAMTKGEAVTLRIEGVEKA